MATAGIGALVAAIVAVLAWVEARKSARAAEGSAEAARDSLELQRSEAARARERTDVMWAREWDTRSERPGLIRYRNVGSTTAHGVSALIRVNEETHVVEADAVAPDGFIELDCTTLYEAERRASEQARAEPRPRGQLIFVGTRFHVRSRLSWETAQGSPGVQVID